MERYTSARYYFSFSTPLSSRTVGIGMLTLATNAITDIASS